MFRATVRVLFMAAAPALLIGTAACSSSNNSKTTTTNTVTNAAAVSSPSAANGPFDEVTTDNKYSIPKITIKAGQPATVNVSNKGAAIHNWHVTDVKDASGKEITTPLQDAGKSASVTFTISKPGTYKFWCDAHTTDMTGQLVVE